jgi:hypothetical protein
MYATALSVLAALALVNYAVDPYWLYDNPRVEGFNFWKTELAGTTQTVKPTSVAWRRPRSVVVGASTAEAGLDPADARAWDAQGYNLALGGAGLAEAVDAMGWALDHGAERVVLVLDFVRFSSDQRPSRLQLPDRRAARGSWFGDSNLLLPTLQVTIGPAAIRDTIETVLNQHEPRTEGAFETEQMIERNGARRPDYAEAQVRSVGGQRAAIRRSVRRYATLGWFPDPCRAWSFRDASGATPGLEELDRAMALARETDAELTLVLPPVHAVMLVAMQEFDVYGDYQQWKRIVTERVEQEAAARGSEPFPLHDFGVIAPETSERIPDDDTPLERFTDPAHFRPSLGVVVFERIADPDDDRAFGRRLRREFLDAHLAEDEARLSALDGYGALRSRFVVPALDAHAVWLSGAPGGAHCGGATDAADAASRAR